MDLGAVIGTRARYVSEKTALSYVAGYCLTKDVTERSFQIDPKHLREWEINLDALLEPWVHCLAYLQGAKRWRQVTYRRLYRALEFITREQDALMDLKRISNLIQVAEYGSFSKAASVLGIAQPALGRQVKKLEEECGTALLYRHGRGVHLTPDGEKLLDRVQPLLRQMELAVLELHDERHSPSGAVTIGLTPTLCGMLGMRLIKALRQDHPRIQLNVITGYSGYVHEWLMNARVDLAVLHDARKSSQIVVDPLAEIDLSLVSSPAIVSSAARQEKSFSVKDLAGIPLVLPTRNHGLRRTVESAAQHAGIEINVAFEIDALELMKEVVEEGLAHTILAATAVEREIEDNRLMSRVLDAPGLSTRLVIASSANRPVTRAVRIVDTTLRKVVAEVANGHDSYSHLRILDVDG